MTAKLAVTVTLATVALAGCADPYRSDRARPVAPPSTSSQTTKSDIDRPGPPAGTPPATAERPPRSARKAARVFATRWANWDWRSVARQQRALARLASGDLARQLRANANSSRIDASLARDKPASRGTVAAVELKSRIAQAAGIVVTREQPYSDGRADLGGRRYRVYLIRLTREQNGWGVSAWEPQP